MHVTIRAGVAGDYERVIPTLDDWWGGRRMAAMLPRLFFEHFPQWTFVADEQGNIVGFLSAFRSQSDSGVLYCHFVGVEPSIRGRGIGEALYQRLFADALADGCAEVLAVTFPSNQASVAFHPRLGFDVLPGPRNRDGVPFIPDCDGPGEDRVRFARRLAGHSAQATA